MSTGSSTRRNSLLLAAAVAIGLVAWLLSGLGNRPPAPAPRTGGIGDATISVKVRDSSARETMRTIVTSGRTEPDRRIEIKAETAGVITAIGVQRGAIAASGQTIVELDMRDRLVRLEEAEALVRQRELEYAAAEQLRREQFMSEAELARSFAELVAARAAEESITLDIERTEIKAPFDAIIRERFVEIGDYVEIGDRIAELVDTDPLIVVADLNERDVGTLAVGSSGKARVLGGPDVEGRVRYLAPIADESTRSFRIELAIPNPGHAMRVGTSAEIVLGAESIVAHELSSALLTLADDGRVGIKTVDSTGRVRFVPIEIADATDTGRMLITGLPPLARIITVGQGYVVDGQTVDAVPEDSTLTQAENERPY